MKIQTLKEAEHLARSGKSKALRSAAVALHGKPVGSWGETQSAMRDLRNDLPLRMLRAYTVDEFVSAIYTVDSSDRYRSTIN